MKADLWVWAPTATRVEVVTDTGRLPMGGPDDRGHWSVTLENVEAGKPLAV